MPGYKQTEAGVIPEDWDVDVVGNSFEICNQLRLPISNTARERMAGPYPYYGPTGIQGRINEYRVNGKYALIGEDGDHFLKWQSQSMTLLVEGKFNVNNHAHLVCGKANQTEWFYWYFSNRDITPHLTRQGAGRFKLTKASLLQIACPLPSQLEQRNISKVLSDINTLIGSLEELISKKRDIKQTAMQELLTGKRRLPGFEGEWEVKRLENHVIFLRNGVNSRAELLPEGRVKYLHYGDIHSSTEPSLSPEALPSLPDAKAARLDRLRDGDLIFADASEDLAGVCKSVELHCAGDTEVVSGLHTIAARFDKTIFADNFKGFLQFSPLFSTHLRRLGGCCA